MGNRHGSRSPRATHRPLAAALALLLAPRAAAAQTEQELGTRRLLLEQAREAQVANDHTRAIELARRALAIRSSASLRLFLATEYAVTNAPAEAFGFAAACLQEGERDTTMPSRALVLQGCREVMDAQRARVGYVNLRVRTPAPQGLQALVNDEPVSSVVRNTPYIVSPGRVRVRASAPGRTAFDGTVTVTARQTVDVEIDLPEFTRRYARSSPTVRSFAGETTPAARSGSASPTTA